MKKPLFSYGETLFSFLFVLALVLVLLLDGLQRKFLKRSWKQALTTGSDKDDILGWPLQYWALPLVFYIQFPIKSQRLR